jgi:HEAT repeat protein
MIADWDSLARHAWNADGEAALLAHAGQADGAQLQVLLQILSDENHDDVFRHRLTLAVRCAAAAPEAASAGCRGLLDELTAAAFTVWWDHALRGTLRAVEHLTVVLPTLIRLGARCDGVSLRHWIWRQLELPREDAAAEAGFAALGVLGSLAVDTEALEGLLESLRHGKPWRRNRALRALVCVGPAAATPEILDRLAVLLQEHQGDVVQVLETVRRLAEAAGREVILDALFSLRGACRPDAGTSRAFRELLEAHLPGVLSDVARAVPDAFAARICVWLQDDLPRRRSTACAVLQTLRDTAEGVALTVLVRHLPALQLLLRLGTLEMRLIAYDTTQGTERAAVRDELMPLLIERLADRSSEAWSAAVRAAGRLGADAATPPVLDLIVAWLRDGRDDHRRRALELVHALGPHSVREDVLAELLRCCRSGPLNRRRQEAIWVTRGLGSVSALAALLDVLPPLLHDDSQVRLFAVAELREIGEWAALPQILAQLTERVAVDWHDQVRALAVSAIATIGIAAGRVEYLERVVQFLGHSCSGVRDAAVASLADCPPALRGQVACQTVRAIADLARTNRVVGWRLLPVLGGLPPEVRDRVGAGLKAPDNFVHLSTLKAARDLGELMLDPAILARLARLLREPGDFVKMAVLRTIGDLGGRSATDAVLDALADLLKWFPSVSVLATLARVEAVALRPALGEEVAEWLQDSEPSLREAALDALSQPTLLSDPEWLARIAALVGDPAESVRRAAVRTVCSQAERTRTPAALERLGDLLDSPDTSVQTQVLSALHQLADVPPPAAVLPRLVPLLHAEACQVRTAAAELVSAYATRGIRFFHPLSSH